MLTSGIWYFRRGLARHAMLNQKVEWGISDKLQVAAFAELLRSSNALGSTKTALGDVEIGARYTWRRVGSEYIHVAVALDAGLPTGNVRSGLGEGTFNVSPSLLVSREIGRDKYQAFAATGLELIVKWRRVDPTKETTRNSFFSNAGFSVHLRSGWLVGEVSVSTNRWNGGNETQLVVVPAYIWRVANRTELLFGVPLGLTSSTDHVGGVFKFTFEPGGKPE
jgi:hypothetical protein